MQILNYSFSLCLDNGLFVLFWWRFFLNFHAMQFPYNHQKVRMRPSPLHKIRANKIKTCYVLPLIVIDSHKPQHSSQSAARLSMMMRWFYSISRIINIDRKVFRKVQGNVEKNFRKSNIICIVEIGIRRRKLLLLPMLTILDAHCKIT